MNESGSQGGFSGREGARESIGAYLAGQRRLRGISIEELSQQTRIPLRSLARLEAGSFDADVDGFVRGFVRTVADALGLDPDETLNRTLREPDGASQLSAQHLSVRRVLATGLALVFLAGVGFAVQLIATSLISNDGGAPGSPVVMRRDPVRALAEAQGVAALASAPASALASQAARAAADEPPRDPDDIDASPNSTRRSSSVVAP